MTEAINPDVEAFIKTHNDDLWVYDKLILSRKLGYICGPKGQPVPEPGEYIVRPVMNMLGMGVGAKKVFLEDSTEALEDGYFWCEIFEGPHISIDYRNQKQSLAVEGIRANSQDLGHWLAWKKVDISVPYPKVLKSLTKRYKWVNIEMIGDKIIEVHLRRNPDFIGHSSDYVIPIWDHQKFIKNEDQDRKGFYVSR